MAKKTNYTPWIIGGIALLLVLVLWSSYNGLVTADVAVDTAWGQVESVYQRRADLIPNLVETVKGYQIHEQELLTSITEARSRWQSAPSAASAGQLDSALSRLIAVAENYPDLKANQNFLALQDELAGTENRISVERQRYNKAVGDYNIKTRRFPSNIVASLFGFEKAREFFEADAGAESAPDVKF